MGFATLAMRLAPAPDDAEAGLFVGADRARIVAEDAQHDVVQAQGVEAVVEHEHRRLGAVSLAPAVRLADVDAELSGPMAVVDAMEIDSPDRTHRRALVDHEV